MLKPIVPTIASTNTQNALCLSCLLSLSLLIVIEASDFARTLQPLLKLITQSLVSPNQTGMNFWYARLILRSHESYRRRDNRRRRPRNLDWAHRGHCLSVSKPYNVRSREIFRLLRLCAVEKSGWQWHFATASDQGRISDPSGLFPSYYGLVLVSRKFLPFRVGVHEFVTGSMPRIEPSHDRVRRHQISLGESDRSVVGRLQTLGSNRLNCGIQH